MLWLLRVVPILGAFGPYRRLCSLFLFNIAHCLAHAASAIPAKLTTAIVLSCVHTVDNIRVWHYITKNPSHSVTEHALQLSVYVLA